MDGKGSLSGDIRSTGNFIKHLKQMHEWHYKKYLNHKNDLKIQMKKSKHKDHSQSSVKAWVKGFHSVVSKIKLLQLVASYIIEEMRPVVTVEKPAFRTLIKQLSGLTPPSRQAVTNYCIELEESKKTALKVELQAAKYCCTTADIWSHHSRSFMGVTGHIIDKDNFQRKSYLLACRRMKFSHNFLDIAKTLLDIHEEYDLQASKLVATVTDNASNFGKVFSVENRIA
ncbi:uncharacterized protein LOC107267233 isoform X1 [Cephus cinctus]|uniref:Uncharacterized protein LOC107267233 isoform X1 n=1 Tax=Cephus cinctus TaxID=211228 RepID=A0AAJ7FJ05_CEPCN|nr:uncharacterized protein LOC107267233 isoform X1 [Cephus cinctus]